jgi:hypothetical protein
MRNELKDLKRTLREKKREMEKRLTSPNITNKEIDDSMREVAEVIARVHAATKASR